jgi:hypothetical protein
MRTESLVSMGILSLWPRSDGCKVLRSCIMPATSKMCCARSHSGAAESSSMHDLTCGLCDVGIRSQRRCVLCTLHT